MAVVVGAPDLLPASDSGLSSRDNRTNVAAPTFIVRAPGAEGITLFRAGDAEPLGTGVPGAKPGTWSVTSRPLSDGLHVIRAEATGSALRSAPLRVEIRTAPPPLPTVNLCRCTDSGVKGDGITSAVAPRFVGTAPAGAVVSLAIEGGASLGRVRADARGNWAFVARRPQVPEGEQRINLPFTSPILRQWVGPIVFTSSPDGRVYDVPFPDFGPVSGTYALRLLARQSGVVDAAAGNPLVGDASVTFSIE
jgi:hypothetical protein